MRHIAWPNTGHNTDDPTPDCTTARTPRAHTARPAPGAHVPSGTPKASARPLSNRGNAAYRCPNPGYAPSSSTSIRRLAGSSDGHSAQ